MKIFYNYTTFSDQTTTIEGVQCIEKKGDILVCSKFHSPGDKIEDYTVYIELSKLIFFDMEPNM